MNEAPPVVTGKSDDVTVFAVFRGWRNNPEQQERFNPWVEVEQAHQIRNEAIRCYQVMAPALAGTPANVRIAVAQNFILRRLYLRGWSRSMVENYLSRSILVDEWRSLAS